MQHIGNYGEMKLQVTKILVMTAVHLTVCCFLSLLVLSKQRRRFDPSFSTPAIWSVFFQSCIFYPCDLVHHFLALHLSRPVKNCHNRHSSVHVQYLN